jgi:orotidine-5'-phosphate decarboxylase
MTTFNARITAAVHQFGPLCVGIDPRIEMLPKVYQQHSPAEAFELFSVKVLELVRPFCGVIKPQAAFFELFGAEGLEAMASVLAIARQMGFVTILDAKRGDIASTATAYAEAAFGPTWDADSLTVNPYLGQDAIEPFIREARKSQRGLFVLVRTSNPGAGLFQNLNCDGLPLYRHVANAVLNWDAGHGDVGAVVGATHPKELAELRSALPNVWFLVPGYGAQGGTAADVQAAFNSDGSGAVVNSSRGVVFPFQPEETNWEAKVVEAAKRAQTELRQPGS